MRSTFVVLPLLALAPAAHAFVAMIPEPGTMSLAGIGVAAAVLIWRLNRNK